MSDITTLAAYTVFRGGRVLAEGGLEEVIVQTKRLITGEERHGVLIFSNQTGRTFDLDLSGSEKELLHRVRAFLPTVAAEPVAKGPGRPKLGVVAREVSLLPRHWEWLETQQGGASSTLRKLVEQASKAAAGSDQLRQARDRTYQFISVMAGDRAGYEEALRALYKDDREAFAAQMAEWPRDVQLHALRLADAAN